MQCFPRMKSICMECGSSSNNLSFPSLENAHESIRQLFYYYHTWIVANVSKWMDKPIPLTVLNYSIPFQYPPWRCAWSNRSANPKLEYSLQIRQIIIWFPIKETFALNEARSFYKSSLKKCLPLFSNGIK